PCGDNFEPLLGEACAEKGAAALPNRLLKKTLRQGRRHLRGDGKRSRAFAKDRDISRIAAERGDVVMHPPKRGQLIEQPVIAGGVMGRFLNKLRVRKKTEHPQPVI